MSANQDQLDYWNGPGGRKWVETQEEMDRNMSSIHDSLMKFVAVKPGERVLDIGCGCGTTTLTFAQAVGPTGHATGLDISAPMLGLARARAGSLPVDFLEADASNYPFRAEYDVVASRFGVMFFSDPVAAFANIRKALKPGGRLAFVCWRTIPENLWSFVPFTAARDLLPPQPAPNPNAPGPFSLADPARLKSILESAGFGDVRIENLDSVFHIADTARKAAEASLEIGLLSRAAAQLDDATKAKIVDRVTNALKEFETPDGVSPPAACWLVSAKAR